jgi:alanine dehydrogenase
MVAGAPMLILDRMDTERLLDMQSCIDVVEEAFRARGLGFESASSVAGVKLQDGKLHAKLATLTLRRPYAVAKVNANLPGNPANRELPSIQGVVLLFDAATGVPLAAIDSGPITAARTAAASAVAAKWLAPTASTSLAIIGCGVQARAHVAAMRCVRTVARVAAYDVDKTAAESFCREMRTRFGLQCDVATDPRTAATAAEIVVTLTNSRQPILDTGDVRQGTFIAAVGADSEDKQEIGVELLRQAAVVVDDLDQCARMGDLHHALVANALTVADVRASLDQVVSGRVHVRHDEKEIVVFDSTGVAIEDAAAAAIVYERATAAGVGISTEFGGLPLPDPDQRPIQ